MDNYKPGTHAYDPHAPWNEPDAPECLNVECCATLDAEWTFCPYCGERIDWWTVWGCGE